MHVTGFWAVAHLQSEYPDVEFGVVPIPVPEGGEQVTVYGGWTHMISSESDHIPEAMEFTRWLWVESDDFPRLWACEQNTKFSPNELVNNACADVFQAPPNDIFTNEILPSARAQPPYPARITDAVVDGIQAAMFGGASGEEAAELAADQIDEFLETYDGAPMPTG